LIRRSPLLIMALVLVIFMQVSIGLMDYIFNTHLELNILEQDFRTAYMGRLVGWTNLLSFCFQILGGFVMIKLFGVRGSHRLIPLVLLGNALFCYLVPSFAIISFSYVFLKAIDFSIFGVMREMLYIPMKLDEKFRAKAIIDVFAYRSSKALVAACILLFQYLLGPNLLPFMSLLPPAVFLVWIIFVFIMQRRTSIYFGLNY
jgi:ATP/ADP translocase